MRNLRATDVKQNKRVILPGDGSIKLENQLEVRRNAYMAEFRKYVAENCDEKSRQKTNLTPAQRRGIQKLNKRQKEGELIIAMTDKSGRLAAVETELYMKMAESHTCHDVEVGPEEIHRTQRVLNGHVSEWIKMTGMVVTRAWQQKEA